MEWIMFLCSIAAAAEVTPSESCLLRTAEAVELGRADLLAIQTAVETAADRLLAGGKLWASGNPALVSEITGRAGGLMMIRSLGTSVPAAGDVVLHFPESGGTSPDGPAFVAAFGGADAKGAVIPTHAEVCGISPSLAQAIPAWLFTGELVAALTRRGKMPVIFESIGAYGGYARMTQYKNGEVPFHDDKQVPPVAYGVLGNRFADNVSAMLRRVDREQRAQLERAGAWAREARAAKRQLFMYSMGHLFPDEVGKTALGAIFRSAVWNAGFRGPKPEDAYHAGDVAILIGYQHPPGDLLRKTRPAGAQVAYTALFADRDFVHDSGVVWIDPMWSWPDACVPLEGYDVPLLPASGIVNAAIAWELYRLTAR